MKLLKVKTGRFSEIVEKAGRPESYTLWQKPSADRHLQSAIKNNRIMTIQRTESGTEFGIVGFKQTKDARYLVFPKSLKRFENRRVVGINWDLVPGRELLSYRAPPHGTQAFLPKRTYCPLFRSGVQLRWAHRLSLVPTEVQNRAKLSCHDGERDYWIKDGLGGGPW